jgi:hypothetical protein
MSEDSPPLKSFRQVSRRTLLTNGVPSNKNGAEKSAP